MAPTPITPEPCHIPAMAFRGWPDLPAATPRDDAETWVRLARRTLELDRAAFAEALQQLAAANREGARLRRISLATWSPTPDALRRVHRRRLLVRGSERNLAKALAAMGGE